MNITSVISVASQSRGFERDQILSRLLILQSLYFPGNQSSGIIPATKSDLTFVGYLAFSYNNLPERIPSSTQLQSSDASVFAGNSVL
ncbi:hypothetical protein SADUNF_Sadunf12G0022500 [Salix dunnii]|uniref:Uncharacterized protein n=1 Tax=Salix dunnii TaxID=1413687 RepID=A0A835MVL1_9ROSI|nr:hypothetical protein SADUNF_Sadunf12G0022500 [Salix dunnii]